MTVSIYWLTPENKEEKQNCKTWRKRYDELGLLLKISDLFYSLNYWVTKQLLELKLGKHLTCNFWRWQTSKHRGNTSRDRCHCCRCYHHSSSWRSRWPAGSLPQHLLVTEAAWYRSTEKVNRPECAFVYVCVCSDFSMIDQQGSETLEEHVGFFPNLTTFLIFCFLRWLSKCGSGNVHRRLIHPTYRLHLWEEWAVSFEGGTTQWFTGFLLAT